MPKHKTEFESGTSVSLEEISDMRERLLANLRSQTNQSRADRSARIRAARQVRASKSGIVFARLSLEDGEPQAVLIKNRNKSLENDVLRLRSKYAKLLTEEVNR